jgi:hypothetical protein
MLRQRKGNQRVGTATQGFFGFLINQVKLVYRLSGTLFQKFSYSLRRHSQQLRLSNDAPVSAHTVGLRRVLASSIILQKNNIHPAFYTGATGALTKT